MSIFLNMTPYLGHLLLHVIVHAVLVLLHLLLEGGQRAFCLLRLMTVLLRQTLDLILPIPATQGR